MDKNTDERVSVRFFCPECGKEMWTLLDCVEKWDGARRFSLASLKILLVCSDCLLEEIRADKQKDLEDPAHMDLLGKPKDALR